jgi:hypothetical protein
MARLPKGGAREGICQRRKWGTSFFVDISPRNSVLKLKRLRRDGTAVRRVVVVVVVCRTGQTPLTAYRWSGSIAYGKLALHCRSPGHKRKAPIEPLSRVGSFFPQASTTVWPPCCPQDAQTPQSCGRMFLYGLTEELSRGAAASCRGITPVGKDPTQLMPCRVAL